MGEIIEPTAWRSADEPGSGAFPERLAERVRAFVPTGFAVLDGGLFDDLPSVLRSNGLFARSLFVDHADVEAERAGPWILPLAQTADAPGKVFNLVGNQPSVVFWSCSSGEATLFRHLRTLNLARIPSWTASAERAPQAGVSTEKFETAMFRHWDPRVLGAMLPVLDAAQFARIVGPAEELAFWSQDLGELRRVVANLAWPVPRPGMLSFRPEQIEALNRRRLGASHRRIGEYLRNVAPVETASVADNALQTHVAVSDRTGRRLGLESEAAHARWAFLMIKTNGRILNEPTALRFITEGPGHPDHRVKRLLSATAVSLRRQEAVS